jgi:transposase
LGEKTIEQRGYPLVKVLSLDEVAPHKGHGRYRLIISAPQLGIVLDVLKDRRKETLEAWFDQRGSAWCAFVEVCCADMWEPYHLVAQAKLSQARLVVDRFHLMKNLNDAISKARRTIQNQADEATKTVLKGCRWLLVKNRENLTTAEKQKLEIMLTASPELKSCYELKEAFRDWFNQPLDRQTAEVHLQDWIAKVQANGLKALQSFVKTLNNWWTKILNYFEGRYTNGFAEGINLKIKLINRRGYGYSNFDHFRLHVLVAFEPVSR